MAASSLGVAVTTTAPSRTPSMAAPVRAIWLRCWTLLGPSTRYCLLAGGSGAWRPADAVPPIMAIATNRTMKERADTSLRLVNRCLLASGREALGCAALIDGIVAGNVNTRGLFLFFSYVP